LTWSSSPAMMLKRLFRCVSATVRRTPLFPSGAGIFIKLFSKQPGNGPGFAVADDPAVDIDDADDLGGGAGQEEFITDIQIEPRKILLDDL